MYVSSSDIACGMANHSDNEQGVTMRDAALGPVASKPGVEGATVSGMASFAKCHDMRDVENICAYLLKGAKRIQQA